MWPLCNANSPWWLLIPLLLGLLTGWWAWANRNRSADSDESSGGIGSMVGGAIGAAGAGIAGAADAVSSGVSGAVDSVSSGVSGAVDSLSSGVAGVAGAVGSGVSGAVDAASSGVAGVAGAVGSAVSGAVDAVGSGVSGAIDAASGAADSAASGVSNLVGKAGDLAGTGTAAVAAAGAGAVAAAGATVKNAKRAAKSAIGSADGDASDAEAAGGKPMTLVSTDGAGGGISAAAAAGAIGIAAAVGDPDDLLKIKGVGPKLNGLLNRLGVTRFDQIAAWDASDVEKVDGHMEDFQGRIGREEWVPQAKLLATGQHTEWERLYGVASAAAGAASTVALTAIGIPAAIGDPDNLLQLKGVGPKLNALLISLGVTRFDQIAAWGDGEIDKVDDHLGSFKSRIGRDGWVEQAGLLAAGKIADFEAKYGKLDSENK